MSSFKYSLKKNKDWKKRMNVWMDSTTDSRPGDKWPEEWPFISQEEVQVISIIFKYFHKPFHLIRLYVQHKEY